MPPTKRKSNQASKRKGKKNKVKEEEFSDGFESPISEHHEDLYDNSGSDSNLANAGDQHEAIVGTSPCTIKFPF